MLTNAELVLLGLVAESPRHAYELERVIEQRGVREWTSLGFSSIYYVLGRLADRGLVEHVAPDTGPRPPRTRVPYRITPAGRTALREASIDAIANPAPRHDRVLVGIANGPGLAPTELAGALAQRESRLRAELERMSSARAAQRDIPPAAEALFDYAEQMIRADLEWTRRSAGRLRGDP